MMTTDFQPGSGQHLLILAAVLAGAGALAIWARRSPASGRFLAVSLGAVIALNELIWYGYVFRNGLFRFPDALPLDLCDIVLWLTVFTLFTRQPACNAMRPPATLSRSDCGLGSIAAPLAPLAERRAGRPLAFELAYYWGLSGTSMALLTPDLAGPFLSYANIKFFLAHGGVVMALLFLTWGKLERPRGGSLLRAFLLLNAYVLAVALFNFFFKTNYLYLCEKPAAASVLDYFGSWPWYLLPAEALALILFTLLWLPFRPRGRIPGRCPGL